MWEPPYPFNTVIDDHICPSWQLLDQINDLSTSSFFYDTSLTLSAYDPTTLEEKLNKDLNEVQKGGNPINSHQISKKQNIW